MARYAPQKFIRGAYIINIFFFATCGTKIRRIFETSYYVIILRHFGVDFFREDTNKITISRYFTTFIFLVYLPRITNITKRLMVKQKIVLYSLLGVLSALALSSCSNTTDSSLERAKEKKDSQFEDLFRGVLNEKTADVSKDQIKTSDLDKTEKDFLLELSELAEDNFIFEEFFLEIAEGGNPDVIENRILSSSLSRQYQEPLILILKSSVEKQTLRDAGGDYTDFLTPDQKKARKKEIRKAAAKALSAILQKDPAKAVKEAQEDLQRIRDKYTDIARKNGWKG